MRAKLALTTALAHHPKLLVLDEATSGLDPVVRSEMLDLFLEFIQDEEHSILLSSHITSDLEKVADYITFIHAGKIVFSKTKDDILEQYGVVKCEKARAAALDGAHILGRRDSKFDAELLVDNRPEVARLYPGILTEQATIDDIMTFLPKERTTHDRTDAERHVFSSHLFSQAARADDCAVFGHLRGPDEKLLFSFPDADDERGDDAHFQLQRGRSIQLGFLRADTARHAPGHRGREISAFYGALLGTGVIASVLCGVLDSFTYRNGFLEIAASTGGVIVVYMLVTVFMLPLFFKLGAEKARVAMTLCFILPFLLIVWGFSWLGDGAAAFVESLPWPMIATVGGLILVLLCAASFSCL